jgi:hypothetical protein
LEAFAMQGALLQSLVGRCAVAIVLLLVPDKSSLLAQRFDAAHSPVKPGIDSPAEATPGKDIEEALWWLPEDTMSLVVARGDPELRILAIDLERDRQAANDMTFSGVAVYSLLGPILNGALRYGDYELEERIAKRFFGPEKIRAVLAAGRYTAPKRNGNLDSYVVVLLTKGESPLLVKELRQATHETHEVADSRVLELSEEGSEGRVYIAAARDDVVFLTVTLDRMRLLLSRMGHKAERRALPKELPEWRYVDTKSPFWALRHYDPEVVSHDRTSMPGLDANGKGLAVFYTEAPSRSVVLRYVSSSPDADVRFKRMLARWLLYYPYGSKQTMPFERKDAAMIEHRFLIRRADDKVEPTSTDVVRIDSFITWYMLPLTGVSNHPRVMGDKD